MVQMLNSLPVANVHVRPPPFLARSLPMRKLLVGIGSAALLLTVLFAPLASAGIGTAPTHWSFKFDDRGVWHADGVHVSFSWTLKPLEVYDLAVDGVMLIEEISFPVDADAYSADGASFKVMMGKQTLFRLNDNAVSEMKMDCEGAGSLCVVEFPEGSEVMPMNGGGKGGDPNQFHVEYENVGGTVVPCGSLTGNGIIFGDVAQIMFTGSAHLRYPVGQSM